MIWPKLELHGPGYHEYYQYPEELVDSESCQKRNYLATGTNYNPDYHKIFLTSRKRACLPVRRVALGEHVRFLCLDLKYDTENLIDPWGTIARFPNLDHLELTVPWAWGDTFDTACRGFRVERASSSHEAAHGSTASSSVKALLELRTSNSLCSIGPLAATSSSMDGPILLERKPGSNDEDSASGNESEDDDAVNFDEKAIAPRGLPSLLDKIKLSGQSSSLTRLSLSRPTQSAEDTDYRDEYVSVKLDLVILQEWAALIRTTRGALEHLILEHRPFAEEIQRDSTGDREFLVFYPYDPGCDRFVEHSLPALHSRRGC
ncbi:hypothetical protein B0H14DRAFT_938446 [Mycena olivaceomarginata]|nr:hypothetical protein B0H14DRAFT_938446 [Mycena olivaceomarginata]